MVFFMCLSCSFLSGCSKSKESLKTQSVKTEAQTNSKTKTNNKINYTSLYRGFITIREGTDPMPPNGIIIFQSNDSWKGFCDKYMPEVYSITSMLNSLDFNNYCVVYIFSINEKTSYGCSILVDSLHIVGGQLQPSFVPTEADLSNLYFAENRDNIVHPFVNILRVSKDDIPETTINLHVPNK